MDVSIHLPNGVYFGARQAPATWTQAKQLQGILLMRTTYDVLPFAAQEKPDVMFSSSTVCPGRPVCPGLGPVIHSLGRWSTDLLRVPALMSSCVRLEPPKMDRPSSLPSKGPNIENYFMGALWRSTSSVG